MKGKQPYTSRFIFIYTKIKTYIPVLSAVCSTLDLDLRQGLIVLKSSLFSIIWQFLVMGVNIFFCFGGPSGVMACGGDDTL